MKRLVLILTLLVFICVSVYSSTGESFMSCSIDTVIRMPDMISSPMEIKRYFYLNNVSKKVYDKSHKLLVSEYENEVYTIHYREDNRTERWIYNTKYGSVELYGKQRRGYYYPWIGYNGRGNCTVKSK
ncbi:MAG: hypothetical protein LUB59_01420 [Candidatus Gastranaerophilales bacterium]|nr:hypothetical protein [Candidatus Gastranaerophilales bacterium]